MTVVDDLRCARAQVAQGWYKGWLTDREGNVCAVGAVNRACYGHAIIPTLLNIDWSRRAAVLAELRKHLPAGFEEIADYNDRWSTTKRDILTMFDKALADLGGL